MPDRITLERDESRPAWYVRVEGTLVGVVWRQGKDFKGVREGSSQPERATFASRESAARGLARRAGFDDIDPNVTEVAETRRGEGLPHVGGHRPPARDPRGRPGRR